MRQKVEGGRCGGILGALMVTLGCSGPASMPVVVVLDDGDAVAGEVGDLGDGDVLPSDATRPDAGEDLAGDIGDEVVADLPGDIPAPVATITVDPAIVLKSNDARVHGAGLEIEGNAQGLGAEMLMDRGFEWDRAALAAKGWVPWGLWADDGVVATVASVDGDVVQGGHALELSITAAGPGKNAGVGQGGLGVVGGRSYTLSVHVRRGDGPAPSLMAVLLDTSVQPIAVLAGPTALPLDSPPGAWAAPSVRLVPTRSCNAASIAFVVQGASVLRFDAASLRPDDASAGVWPELVDAFRDAGVSVVRMGGIAADGYDWGDGIGPRDNRPARRSAYVGTTLDDANLMVAMPYYNDVGTDEFLDFCRAIGADALLTVSFPLGAVAASNWVEYVNGASPGGAVAAAAGWTARSWRSTDAAPPGYFAWLREAYGHAAPWGVHHFEIGNEMWDEELPEPGSVKGPQNLENYAAGVRQFALAMKAVDPTILVQANGRPEPVGYATGYRAGWTARVLEVAGDVIDAIAPHFYGPGDFDAAAMGPEGSFYRVAGIGPTWEPELAATQQAIDARKATGDTGDIRIALTEYNIWQGVLQFKDDGAVNGMTGLLGMATFRNANLRGPVWMANAYDLVGLPFGMVRWEAVDKAAGSPLRMGGWLLQRFYAHNALPVVHPATVQAPTYFVLAGAFLVSNAPVLDVVATSDPAGDRLSLLVVNRAYGLPDGVPTRLDLGGFVAATGTAHVLSGASADARVTFEDPGAIAIADEPVMTGGAFLDYTFRPWSITVLDLHR